MVPAFARSISLSLSPSHKKNQISHHIRSVSFPCPSHPFISHLEEQIRAIRSWATKRDVSISTAWIESGLAQMESLQTALEEFLRLSKTQETLTRASTTKGFLEDFLLLADIYGSFISTIVNLKQHQSDVQSAIRRGDKVTLATCLRSQRRVEREISQLISSLKSTSKCRPLGVGTNVVETEINVILMEAISATSAASMAIFMGVVLMSAAVSSTKKFRSLQMFKRLSTINSSNKNGDSDENLVVMEGLEELERCMENIEGCSESMFRTLLNLRVLLLNISTPSL